MSCVVLSIGHKVVKLCSCEQGGVRGAQKKGPPPKRHTISYVALSRCSDHVPCSKKIDASRRGAYQRLTTPSSTEHIFTPPTEPSPVVSPLVVG